MRDHNTKIYIVKLNSCVLFFMAVKRKEAAKAATKRDDQVKDDWTEEQTQLVIKAANLFPAGTVNRLVRWTLF